MKLGRLRTDGILAAASLCTGLAAAAFITIGQRRLGSDRFAPLSAMWSLWAVASASLTFGFQQRVIALGADRRSSRAFLRSKGALASVGCGVAVGISYVLTAGYTFFSWSPAFWCFVSVGVVIGSAGIGAARGAAAVEERFGALSCVIAGENLLRLMVFIGLLSRSRSSIAGGVALLSGFLIVPVFLIGGPTERRERRESGVRPGDAHLLGLVLVGVIGHLVTTGIPVVLVAFGKPAATASAVFLVLTASRLPNLALQGLVPRLSSWAASAVGEGLAMRVARTRRFICLGGLAATPFVYFIMVTIGRGVVDSVLRLDAGLPSHAYGIIASMALLSTVATTATSILASEAKTGAVFTTWSSLLAPLAVALAAASVWWRGLSVTEVLSSFLTYHVVLVVCLGLLRPASNGRIK